MKKNKGKIIIGMSGGVDSSTAAVILKSQGYDVAGVFLRFWKEDKNDAGNKKSIEDAQRVCKILAIPLKVIDARKKFKDGVVKYFLDEYAAGRTPNPCVFCNENLKFKLLFNLAKKEKADYVATGHYARLRRKVPSSRFQVPNKSKIQKTIKLFQAKDKNKDQSYFLYRLKQEQLGRLIFPLGGYKKEETRELAKKLGLPVFDKSESQNICFIKDDDTQRFLADNIKMKKGKIINLDGKIIGEHQGLPLYTLGQRRGINVGGTGPYYVVSKDGRKNILYVTNEPQKANLYPHTHDTPCISTKMDAVKDAKHNLSQYPRRLPVGVGVYSSGMNVGDVNWISGQPKLPMKVLIKTRYRQEMSYGIIKSRNAKPYKIASQSRGKHGAHNAILEIEFEKPERAVTPGQSAVFYAKNGEVLGGGVIS